MKNLIQEIHRRSMWQVLGIYLGASWLMLQIVDTLAGALGLPEWSASFALFLLIIGLPIVLATAFLQGGMSTKAGEPEPRASAGAGEVVPASAAEVTGARALLTWRRALVGGGAAFALLGVLTVGYLFMRTAGIGPAGTLIARGVFEDRGRIVIAEFGSETGDSLLARATTEAFRIDLAQSAVVRLVERSTIAKALALMDRPEDQRLTPALAREVAEREGVPAIVEGEVNSVGAGYVLSARLVSLSDGSALASDRQNASDSTEVLEAIDRLSRNLRERIGESLRSLSSEAPLARVTTSDLEALRLYSQAEIAFENRNDVQRGVGLLEDAVARDSAFAMAWRKMGIVLSNEGIRQGQSVHAITQAYAHRERLTTRERYITTAAYHNNVTDESGRGLEAYENLLDAYPDDVTGRNNLGVQYFLVRDDARALEYFEGAYRLNPESGLMVRNAAFARIASGDLQGAREVEADYTARFPEDRRSPLLRIQLPAAFELWEEARTAALGSLERVDAGTPLEEDLYRHLRHLAFVEGKLREAAERLSRQQSLLADRDEGRGYLLATINGARAVFALTRDPDPAVDAVAAALDRFPLDGLSPVARPYLQLAELYAELGRLDYANQLFTAFEAEGRPDLQKPFARYYGQAVRGQIALEAGDYEVALTEFAGMSRRGAIGYARAFSETTPLVKIARAHDAAGRPDSATVYYRRYLESHAPTGLVVDAAWRGHSLERLAQLSDAAGDLPAAQDYYASFVELWAEADEELQPRVRAAQARLEDIVREGG